MSVLSLALCYRLLLCNDLNVTKEKKREKKERITESYMLLKI